MTSRTEPTRISQRRRAETAKRSDLELTLMIAAMALAAVGAALALHG